MKLWTIFVTNEKTCQTLLNWRKIDPALNLERLQEMRDWLYEGYRHKLVSFDKYMELRSSVDHQAHTTETFPFAIED